MPEFSEPIPFSEALEKLRAREITPSAQSAAGWAEQPVALRERAFFSAGVESGRLLQAMRDYLEDYLAGGKGLSREDFVAEMRELAIAEGLGRVDPKTGKIDPEIREGDVTDIRSLARLQLIFDTQVEAAQEYGRFLQGQEPMMLDVFPAQRFIRVRPVRAPRPYHEAALGLVERKDEVRFWTGLNRDFGVPWGPWGFNSGCGVEDVDREEAERLGVLEKDEVVRPITRVPSFNHRLKASTRGLDEDLAAEVARGAGGEVAGGEIPAPQGRPRSLDRVLGEAGITAEEDMTAEQAEGLLHALSRPEGTRVADVVEKITGTGREGVITRAFVERTVGDFLRMVDPEVIARLPRLRISARQSLGTSRGDYSRQTRLLRLSKGALGEEQTARETLFHELVHWVHEHAPEATREVLRGYFSERTAGEESATLPGFRAGVRGMRDEWADADGDSYAGRVYPWEEARPMGTEVATRHLEKLASATELARHWNHEAKSGKYLWREAFLKVLEALFFPPRS